MGSVINKNCEITGQPFSIGKDEKEVYREFDLPLPTICPQERCRRYLSFRNDKQFFWRSCSKTNSRIYSVFPAETSFPVVSTDYWWSSDFEALEYGQEFDFKRLFIEQFMDLWGKVPRPAYRVRNAIDSRANHHSCDSSSSFMLFNARSVVSCYYSINIRDCHFCCDCYSVSGSEYCYECSHCHDSKKLRWCECCQNCENSWFLSHCSNCRNCLFCTNLEGKEYHIFNQEVSKEEFESTLRDWSFSALPKIELAKEKFNEFLQDQVIPHIVSDNPKKTTGNYLKNCDSAYASFESSDCTDIYHCHSMEDAQHCIDGYGFGGQTEHCAQFVQVGEGAKNLVNCVECWNDVEDLNFCSFCEQSRHLFGCVGLREKEYCIFNKQYSREDYLPLRNKIAQHLKSRSVWGKFFPASCSGFAYNQSAADEHMPLSRIPAKMMGFRWSDSDDFIRPSQLLGDVEKGPEERFQEVPIHLDDVDEAQLLSAVHICEISGRPFRFTKDELTLYRVLSLPLPRRAFEQRHLERVMRLAPRSLGMCKSANSRKEMLSSFPQTWRRPIVSHSEWEKIVRKNSK